MPRKGVASRRSLVPDEEMNEEFQDSSSPVAESRRTRPTSPRDQFLMSFMENFARTQAEVNRQLVETLRSFPQTPNITSTPATPPPATNAATLLSGSANIALCTARFSGQSHDGDVLEAFLDAVSIFKECAGVSDDHALRGLPMLLEGEAAVWWRGTKSSVTSWSDAVARLRAVYGVPQPAHKVFRQIFAEEQQDERAEAFICRLKALITKLPYALSEDIQVDIIYGLLHRRIRKRLSRNLIESVDTLLTMARNTEETIVEVRKNAQCDISEKGPDAGTKPTLSPTIVRDPTTSSSGELSKSNKKRVKCAYCKVYGHVINECRNLSRKSEKSDTNHSSGDSDEVNVIRCYGCGKQGVMRSNCENCKMTQQSSNNSAIIRDAHHIAFNSADFGNSNKSPMVIIGISGRSGVGIIDTGATHSIASPSLYKILVESGVEFENSERNIRLADGSMQSKKVLTANINVTLEERIISTDFMVLPGDDTKTLLGLDFVNKAGMVLDFSHDTWYFADDKERAFSYVNEQRLVSTISNIFIAAVKPSPRKEEALPSDHRCMLNRFIASRAHQFAPNSPATGFTSRTVKVGEVPEHIASLSNRLPKDRGRRQPGKKYLISGGFPPRYAPKGNYNERRRGRPRNFC